MHVLLKHVFWIRALSCSTAHCALSEGLKVESAFPCFTLLPYPNLFHSVFVMQMPKLGEKERGHVACNVGSRGGIVLKMPIYIDKIHDLYGVKDLGPPKSHGSLLVTSWPTSSLCVCV